MLAAVRDHGLFLNPPRSDTDIVTVQDEIASEARLALLLFTGQRRSDVTRFGRQHVRDGNCSSRFSNHLSAET